jgi:hypothetical protein
MELLAPNGQDLISQGVVELKMFDTKPEHAKKYGFDVKNPLYIQSICIQENERLKGIGKKVFQYIDEYAIKNGHDLIFGHITQKANFTKDSRQTNLCDIDLIKEFLIKSGYKIIEGNNDFYKLIKINPDIPFDEGGEMNKNMRKESSIKKDKNGGSMYIPSKPKKLFKGGEVENYNKWKSIDWDSFKFSQKLRSNIYRFLGWVDSERIDWTKMPEKDKEWLYDEFIYQLEDEDTLEYIFGDPIKELEDKFESLMEEDLDDKDLKNQKTIDEATDKLLLTDEYKDLREGMSKYGLTLKDLETKSTNELLEEVYEGKDRQWVIDYYILNDENWLDFKYVFNNDYESEVVLNNMYNYALENGAVFTEEEEAQQFDIFAEVPAEIKKEKIDTVELLEKDEIDTPKELGAVLKRIFKNKYGVTITARYIKTVRGLEGSPYQISSFDSSQSIPNDLRKRFVEIAYSKTFDELNVRTPSNVNYGNISEFRVSLSGKQWIKWIDEISKEKKEEPKEVLYISYLNKDKGFKEDKKYFSFFDEAQEWGRANLENFNTDMIRYEDAKVEELDENKLVQEINSELSMLNELLDDAKEDSNKELISELEDRIEFLEELRDDALPYENGGVLKDFSKIMVNFNTNYTPVRLDFYASSITKPLHRIGGANSELYLDSTKVLNLKEIILDSEYNNPKDMEVIVSLIKRDLEKETGKTQLMIKNSIQ